MNSKHYKLQKMIFEDYYSPHKMTDSMIMLPRVKPGLKVELTKPNTDPVVMDFDANETPEAMEILKKYGSQHDDFPMNF